MVSFSCESCQDTIKKPKLEAVSPFPCFQLMISMLQDVMDHSLVSIVILPFRGEIGRIMSNVSLKKRSIKRVI